MEVQSRPGLVDIDSSRHCRECSQDGEWVGIFRGVRVRVSRNTLREVRGQKEV